MSKVTYQDLGPKCEIPDDLYESLILRCTKATFGPSKSSGEPMITSEWEVVGVRNKEGGVDRSLLRGEQEYVIAGLTTRPSYQSLSKKALRFTAEFWAKATGKDVKEFEMDTENPDTSFYKDLYMSAVCKALIFEKRKPLTEEQKEMLKEAKLPVEGEKVLDDEGNPVAPIKLIQIDSWNKRFSGDVPQF